MTQERISNEIKNMTNQSSMNIKTFHLTRFNSDNMCNLLKELKNVLLDEDFCEKNDIDISDAGNMIFDEIFNLWFQFASKTKANISSLVIFIYDFENFNKQLLTFLIQVLKEYVKQIPIIFVFMIYSQLNSSIQHFLPAHATDCLIIEDIPSYYEPKLINHLLHKFVTDSSIQFKIHPQFLKEICYYLNFELSFSNLLILLKSLLFDHCYSSPLSSILDGDNFESYFSSDTKLMKIFQNSIPYLYKDNYAEALANEYKTLLTQHKIFVFNLEVLIDMDSLCCNSSKSFLELYCKITSTPNYDYNSNLLSSYSRVTQSVWCVTLKRLIEKYRNNKNDPIIACLIDYEHKLADIIRIENEESEKQQESAKKLGLECEVKVIKDKLRNLNSRTEWRASIIPHQRKSELSKFEFWRIDLLNEIETIMKKCSLIKFQHLIDSLFYNDTNFIRKHCFVSTRECLDFSLKNPGKDPFVKNQLLSNSFRNIYPNSFILYQLYKDSSSMINLNDWYTQFCEEKNMLKGKKLRKLSQDELVVNFLSTVSDFEFVGLLQASRYKADFFNKLIWI